MSEKVVFLFGAGAEVPYGLPNGGEFALEIFRLIGEEDKISLRDEIKKVNPASHQAAWVNFHSKCKMLGGVAEFFSEAFLCRFPPEDLPRPVVYPVHSLPV